MISHFGAKPKYAVGDKVSVSFFNFIGSVGVITDIKVEGEGFRYLVDNHSGGGWIIVDWYGERYLNEYKGEFDEW